MKKAPVARRSLAAIAPYAPGEGASLDLSDNTNRWGAAPSALEAMRGGAANAARYPEAYAHSLKAALAAYVGVPPECITTGCGSDGVLDAALRAFGEPGDRVAIPEPTFPMTAAFARANALDPVCLPLTPEYQPDPEALRAAGARIVYLCSPNNPIGSVCNAGLVLEIARATDGLVIVDEAYAEFTGCSLTSRLGEAGNLLVVRTLSKAFGLAGVRVGYAVGAPEVIRFVERSRGPYQVNALGLAAAIAAVRLDVPWMQERVRLARDARERLMAALLALGLCPIVSAANFVLVPVTNAGSLGAAMRRRGVAVRVFRGLRPVSAALAATGGEALRITVGPQAEMDAMLSALRGAMAE